MNKQFDMCGEIIYGEDSSPFISLQPSVEKIRSETGWSAFRSLEDSVRGWEETNMIQSGGTMK